MPMHKDEDARDTTLFRHFLTEMTSAAMNSLRFNGRTRLSFRKQLKDSFTFPAPPSRTTRRLSEANKKRYLFLSMFFIHGYTITFLSFCQYL